LYPIQARRYAPKELSLQKPKRQGNFSLPRADGLDFASVKSIKVVTLQPSDAAPSGDSIIFSNGGGVFADASAGDGFASTFASASGPGASSFASVFGSASSPSGSDSALDWDSFGF